MPQSGSLVCGPPPTATRGLDGRATGTGTSAVCESGRSSSASKSSASLRSSSATSSKSVSRSSSGARSTALTSSKKRTTTKSSTSTTASDSIVSASPYTTPSPLPISSSDPVPSPSLPASTTPQRARNTGNASTRAALSRGAAAGISVSIVAAVALLLVGGLCYLRGRRARRAAIVTANVISDSDPARAGGDPNVQRYSDYSGAGSAVAHSETGLVGMGMGMALMEEEDVENPFAAQRETIEMQARVLGQDAFGFAPVAVAWPQSSPSPSPSPSARSSMLGRNAFAFGAPAEPMPMPTLSRSATLGRTAFAAADAVPLRPARVDSGMLGRSAFGEPQPEPEREPGGGWI